MTHRPQLMSDQPTSEQATREAKWAEYPERLWEKLQNPELRAIKGFPFSEDEDFCPFPIHLAPSVPALSAQILGRGQIERVQMRKTVDIQELIEGDIS